MEADKKRHSAATVLYAAESSQPPSDLCDWAEYEGYAAETCGAWRGHTLRRVRSWVASTPSRHMPSLTTWFGDLGSYIPNMATLRWPPVQRRRSTDGCVYRTRGNSCNCMCDNRRLCRCHNDCSGGVERSDCADDNADVACESMTGAGEKPPIGQAEPMEEIHSRGSSTIGDSQKEHGKGTHVYITDEAEVEAEAGGRCLMSVFQIPEYMVEDYIWDAYRPLSFSYRECLKSWGYVHSELGNIMTHLVGFAVFVVLALITGPVLIPRAVDWRMPSDGHVAPTVADYMVVYTYLFTVLFCLAASVAFHTLSCHSRRKHFRALRCDFIGILMLIVGSLVPIGYYGFVHSQRILIGYMVTFVALGIIGVLVSVFGRVEIPQRAFLRPIMFMTISASGL
ncbi:Adiponectin receptor protein 2, partial [Coemansia sp. IMI 209127]